jgi:uncharacterized membrane protein YecN with MAPEG domain
MQNLTKGEMIFRIFVGLIIMVALYLGNIGTWILWILAGIVIATGIAKYCPLCQVVDRTE